MKYKVMLLLLSLTVSACSIHGGNREFLNPPTLGQELTDLQKAFESGAISEREYTTAKEELLL